MPRAAENRPGRRWLAAQLPSWLVLARVKHEAVAAELHMDPGQFSRMLTAGTFSFADIYELPTDLTVPLVTTWASELGILTIDGMLRLVARALVAWTERPASARMELPTRVARQA